MPAIRSPKAKWGDVWFALLEVGPITRIPPANDYIYIVSQKHIETLKDKKLPYDLVNANVKESKTVQAVW
jgi:hypothetical protein